MPEEDIICQTEVLDRIRSGQVSSSVQVNSSGFTTHDLQLWKVRPPTLEGHISFVRTLIWVFLDSMESPLSHEYSHIYCDKIGIHISYRNHEK